MAISNELVLKIIEDMFIFNSVIRSLKENDTPAREFFGKLNENPELERAYSQTQCALAEMRAEEIVLIADSDHDSAVARNRIEARKWYASKIKPKKYGDRIDLNISTTVDLKGALAEAKSRVASPITIEIPQPTAVPIQSGIQRTELESVKVSEDQDAKALALAKILE